MAAAQAATNEQVKKDLKKVWDKVKETCDLMTRDVSPSNQPESLKDFSGDLQDAPDPQDPQDPYRLEMPEICGLLEDVDRCEEAEDRRTSHEEQPVAAESPEHLI